MKRTLPFLLLLWMLSLVGAVRAAEPGLEDFLPADATLAVCYYGDNPDVEKTALHQLLQEPEVKEWLTSVRDVLRGGAQLAAGFAGVNLAQLTPLLGCRMGLAVLPKPAAPPDLLAVAKVGAEGEVRTSIQGVLNRLAAEGAAKVEVGGALLVPLGAGGCFGFRGDYLFVGSSRQVVERALSPQAPKLAALPAFRQATGLGSSPLAIVAYNHVALMEALGPMLPDGARKVFDSFGLSQAELVVLRVGAKGRALVGTVVVQTRGERKGLLKALAGRPVDKSLLKLCPREASIVWAANLSPEELYASGLDVVQAIVAAAMEEDARGALAAFEQKAGVNLRTDVFGSLGPGVVVTTSGTSLLPALIISVALKDGDRFDGAVTKLVAQLDATIKAEAGPEAGAALRTLEFQGHTVRYLATPGVPVPLAPCYTRAGGRLVLALSPIHLKDYLVFLEKGEATILDHPGFKELAALAPDNAITVGYSDVGEAFIQVYGLLGPFLTMAHGIPGNPIAVDFANLPAKRTLRKHLFGSISYLYATPDTLVYECQSPFGMPFLGPAPAGAPALFLGGIMAGMLLPALTRARGEARLIRDRNNLHQLAKGIATYLNEHGDNRFYPRSLAELWDKKVIPDPGVFVSPLDRAPPKLPNGLACSYVSCFDRHPNRVFRDDFPPNFICAWDRIPFAPERRSVMFFDSHVEVMNEAEFAQRLRELDAAAEKLEERKDKRGEF